MGKLRPWELLLICLTLAFLTFLAGYFVGQRGTAKQRTGVLIETERAGAPSESPELSAAPADRNTSAPELVNINSAGKEELMTLPGIGEELAERILNYRAENGPFRSADELMDVKGIGEGKYAACKDLITIR